MISDNKNDMLLTLAYGGWIMSSYASCLLGGHSAVHMNA